MRSRAQRCTLLLVLALPWKAHAHLVSTGLGPYYDGLWHFLVSIDELLLALGLGLLAGLGGARDGRTMLFALPAAWVLGGAIGLWHGSELVWPLLPTISLMLVGTLVALGRRLPWPVLLALATALGLLHGALNGSAMARGGLGPLGLAGSASAVFVLVPLLAALVVSLRGAWMRVAVQVLGSWIAAVGLLMLGWALRT
jgi:urease accessory protein